MTGRMLRLAILGLAVALAGCGREEETGMAMPKPAAVRDEGAKTDALLSRPTVKDKALAEHADQSTADGKDRPQATAGEWLDGDQRAPLDFDFTLTNQDGREVSLEDFKGKPIALSFFFTSCSNPQMCPLIVLTMANLQRDLEKAGLSDDVYVLLISYDPTRDTPQRMKKFGSDRGFRFDNGAMLRPAMDEYIDLLRELAISVQPMSDGSINHVRELLLIDADAQYVRDYHGEIWSNKLVLADLQRLVEESRAEHAEAAD